MDNINKLLKDITTLMQNPEYKLGDADIDRIKETLKYVKSYSVLMEAGKAVSSAADVKKDIKDSREKLRAEKQKIMKRIQEINEEPVYIGEAPQMHAFEHVKNEIVEEQISAQQERNKKIIDKLEMQLQSIDIQLDRLSQMEANLGNPKQFVEALIPEEMKANMQEYQSLVNMCAVATGHNYDGIQEFQKKPIFEHDGDKLEEGYSINESEAKEFIQFIRNEALMGELSSMFEQEKALDQEQVQLNSERDAVVSNNRTNLDIYTTIMSNPKFEEAIRDINEFNENEPKQSGFPVPTSKLKIINKIRQLFPGKMFPHEMKKMKEFMSKQQAEREAYVKNGSKKITERAEVDEEYKQIIDYFTHLHGDNDMHSLLTYDHIDSKKIRESAENSMQRISEIDGSIERIRAQRSDMRDNLSDDAKKAIEEHGEDNVKAMTEEYYAVEQNDNHQVRYGKNKRGVGHSFDALSRVGASMCLELLLERGNIPNEIITKIAGLGNTNLPDLNTYVKNLTQGAHDMIKKIMEQDKSQEQNNEREER